MAFLSVKEKIVIKYAYCILLILVAAFMCLGCDPYYGEYPHSEESEWACENPQISLSYRMEENGMISQEERLVWAETAIEIDVFFRSSFYVVYPAGLTDYEDRIFSGSWCYRKGNLILKIDEDFIFNDQFDELEFKRQVTRDGFS